MWADFYFGIYEFSYLTRQKILNHINTYLLNQYNKQTSQKNLQKFCRKSILYNDIIVLYI